MSDSGIPIKYAESDEERDAAQGIAREVAKILTPNEDILYVAMQNVTAASLRRDAVVATSNRLIFYRPHLLGKIDFADLQWQDVKDVRIKQHMVSAELTAETLAGRVETVQNLSRDQAKRLYGISQQVEQEWREKRRVREMEEERARAGGIIMHAPSAPATPLAGDDSVTRLAKAKAMLEQGLISEAEYDTLKAKILSDI